MLNLNHCWIGVIILLFIYKKKGEWNGNECWNIEFGETASVSLLDNGFEQQGAYRHEITIGVVACAIPVLFGSLAKVPLGAHFLAFDPKVRVG